MGRTIGQEGKRVSRGEKSVRDGGNGTPVPPGADATGESKPSAQVIPALPGEVYFHPERLLEQRLAQMRLLCAATAGSSQDRLFESLGNFIYLSFLGVIHYDRMALALLEENGARVRLSWHRSEVPGLHLATNHSVPLKGTSLESILASGQPRIIADLAEYFQTRSPSDWTEFIAKEGIQSNVTCPLVVYGQAVGFLLFSSRQRDVYRECDIQNFQRIADEVSNILGAVPRKGSPTGLLAMDDLAKAFVRLVNTMEAAHSEGALLDGVIQKINAGLELDEILDHIYDSFSNLIPYSRMGCALIDEETGLLWTRWVRSSAPTIKLGEGFALPLAGSSLQQILQADKPRILNDLPAYFQAHPNSISTRLLVEEGMRSSLSCPLTVLGKPVGVLFFSSQHPRTYENIHVHTFMRVARQISVIVERGRAYQQLAEERARSEQLLAELLPPVIAQRLKVNKGPIVDAFADVTVLFSDIVDFTTWASVLPPKGIVELLSRIFTEFDRLVRLHGLEKISTKGDGYLAVAGVPEPQADHAFRAAKLALAMRRVARKFTAPQGGKVELRIGLHSGPVIAGTVGTRAYHYDVWGHTVNLASRMETYSQPGRIQVSRQTYEKLRDRFRFTERGPVQIKGFGLEPTWWLEGPL